MSLPKILLVKFILALSILGGAQAQTPSLDWVRTFPSAGAPNIVIPNGVTSDATNNIYTTGVLYNTRDFDPGPGTFNLTSAGNSDIFVSKLNTSGGFVWAIRIGGTGADEGTSIAVDPTGDIYITGDYVGTVDFDPGPGVTNLTGGGSFVAKLTSGGTFVWAKRIGSGTGTAIVADGDIVSIGSFTGTSDFDPGTPVLNLTSFGSTDIFVSKLTPSGDLIWVAQLGGASFDQGFSLTTDATGNVYTTGTFQGTADFDPGAGTESLTSAGSNDIFITKLSSAGAHLWTKRIGSTLSDRTEAITLDQTGNIITTGSFSGTVDFDPDGGTATLTASGSTDAFVSKLNPSGNYLWAKNVGSTSITRSHGVVTDVSGSVYYTGEFSGVVDFDPGTSVFNVTPTLDPAAFVSKLDVNGDFQWVVAPRGAGTGFEGVGMAITLDGAENIVAAGWFNNVVDFDPGVCDQTLTASSDDIYIWKLNPMVAPSTNCIPVIAGFSPTTGPAGTSVIITGSQFSSIISNNIVYFGATQAAVTGATTTTLTVTVPTGATYAPITVTVAGLTAYSQRPFGVTFPNGGVIDACAFSASVSFSADATDWIPGLVISDFDGDGKSDFATTNNLTNSFSIFRNTSTPGVLDASSFAAHVDFATGTAPRGITVGDIDGDGKPDVVVTNHQAHTISVFRNTSTPGVINGTSFAPKVDFATAFFPNFVKITDLDTDGKPDVVAVNIGGNSISIFKNTSTVGSITTGSLAAKVDVTTGTNPHVVDIGDLDNDGKPDLVVSNFNSNTVSILKNISSVGILNTGSFAAPVTLAVTDPDDVVIGDLDGDEKPEITVANWLVDKIYVFRNTSTTGVINSGSFDPPVQFTALQTPESIGIEDIDGDGKPDLAVLSQSDAVSILKNTSTTGSITAASFAGKVDFAALGTPDDAALGDLDGDGRPDLLVSNYTDNKVAVYRNTVSNLPPPTISGFSPTSGIVGTTVVISGANFNPAFPFDHRVRFNGVIASVVSVTSTTLEVTVPAGASTGPISVTIGCNTATGASNFTVSGSCVPAVQRNALIALYNATDGTNWADNTGWLTPDESTWNGVTVTGCNITDISLPGNNLVGTLPPELGDLPMLEGLDLGANQLSGSIPPEIGNLTNLIGLNLAINQLDGILPPELGNLTSLEALNLSFNAFNGTPPIELENLMALIDAALNNNQFTGQPPLIGANSMSMSNLELQFNEFTGLPDFTAYYSINQINVANNRLTFDDLEPFMGLTNFFYDPQALVPPGGIISFIPGGTLNIPFSTGGTGNSYQWYKDNVLIPGATSASLSISGVTAADVGFYQVRITSSVVPVLVLESMVYSVITDPCEATTPTSGDIDATFAPLIDVPSTFSQVEMQSTGKIITESAGTLINSVSHLGLLRFLPDGTLDNTFTPNINTSPFLVQPDDQILASYYGGGYAYVVRMDADGNEDAAFKANVPQYYTGYISALARQPDNKILVAGAAYLVPPFIERLNPDGTSDGLLPDANGLDVSVIRVQSDGYILVGGQFPGGIIRLDPTGVLDPSFSAYTSNFVSDIAIQSDGKILVSGMFTVVNDIPKRGVVRLHPDGSIDNTFTAMGITNAIEAGLNARRIALQTDGKIVLAGEFSSINGADRINVVRLHPDGSVDCLFDPGTGTDLAITGLALPSDTQILISGGFIDYNGTPRLGLARINSGVTGSCVPASERNALVALYNATNGASWTNSTNWLSADESTWHGVIISSCRVTNLNLTNNQLAGTLPPELGDLTQLVTLDLSNNTLTGSLPNTISNLVSLSSLQLYNNQLSGSLPAGLYGLSTLQNLDLSNNQLTGSVSTSIGNLIGLTSLSLSINQFTGTLPSEIGNLTNLQYLRLALNQFSGSLPGTFGNLLQLREFTVATNLLTGTVPASLVNLTNLNVLGLSFNGFTGDLPAGIGSLSALQQVSVRSNQFTSLPAFTSTSITELRTENNRFHFGHLEPNATKGGFTYTPQANLAGGTATTCEGTTLTIPFTTPGTANQYQWYKDGVLLPGATSSSFTKSSATPGDAGNYVVQVTNTLLPGLTLVSDPFVVSINGAPPAPTVTGATSCTAGTLTLTASGGSPGEYRWYATATGGADLGTGSGTFVTPLISVTTIFHVAINNGTCEGTRTPVTATIDAVSKPTITTSNCTASGVTLAGPTGFASYTWSNGATTSQITITTGGTYTLVVTTAGGCVSPASDGVTFTNSFCNQPPALQPTPVATTVQSTVTVNISAIASDLDNNIDLNSLQVISQPTSGATAFINANFELVIDYSGVSFVGTDQLTIELCDVAGACVQEVITIEVAGDITVYNALSPNGDGKNDVLYIQYIDALPDTQQNKLTILNRWGSVVFEATNYDNTNTVFRGLSSSGTELPPGTYYYVLEFSSGAPKRTGFISLRR